MFVFDVKPDGGSTYRLVADSRDVGVWERTTKGNPSLAKLEQNAAMSDLEVIAYHAAKRQGAYEGSLTEWRATCPITPIDEEAEKAKARKAREDAGEDVDNEDDEPGPSDPIQTDH